jgi:hypothetical protein
MKRVDVSPVLLYDLYILQEKSSQAIAIELGLSQTCIMNNLVRYEFPTRPKTKKTSIGRKMFSIHHSETIRKLWDDGRYNDRVVGGDKQWKYSGGLCKKIVCKVCGKIIHTNVSRDYKYCSISCFAKDRIGDRNANWQGGISCEPYTIEFNKEFKDMIKERDNYCCVLCEKHIDDLVVHHIDYDKTNTISENCVSLCRSCHSITCFNRDEWELYFIDYTEVLYEIQ